MRRETKGGGAPWRLLFALDHALQTASSVSHRPASSLPSFRHGLLFQLLRHLGTAVWHLPPPHRPLDHHPPPLLQVVLRTAYLRPVVPARLCTRRSRSVPTRRR
jgi:hypothetical protein